jgi:predicted amidohydrolase
MNGKNQEVDGDGKWIAVAQLTSTKSVEQNYEICRNLVQKAKKLGAAMIFFPECFAFMGESASETVAIGESLEGPLFSRYKDLAQGIWISFGGFPEKLTNEDRVYNTHVVVDDTGQIRAVYRKIHLFQVDIPGGPSLNERRSTKPGDELVVVDTTIGRLGLSVCFDIRFPEMYISLRQKEATILVIPAAFTVATGKDHWDVLLRARAIENQCYVVAAAQFGVHNAQRTTWGRATVVDPWGIDIAVSSDLSPNLILAEIQPQRISSVRKCLPLQRRSDIYGTIK